MRLPFVSRRRYEAVKAERDRLRREEAVARGLLRIRLKADMWEFDEAMERAQRMVGATSDEIARLGEEAKRLGPGEHR